MIPTEILRTIKEIKGIEMILEEASEVEGGLAAAERVAEEKEEAFE